MIATDVKIDAINIIWFAHILRNQTYGWRWMTSLFSLLLSPGSNNKIETIDDFLFIFFFSSHFIHSMHESQFYEILVCRAHRLVLNLGVWNAQSIRCCSLMQISYWCSGARCCWFCCCSCCCCCFVPINNLNGSNNFVNTNINTYKQNNSSLRFASHAQGSHVHTHTK